MPYAIVLVTSLIEFGSSTLTVRPAAWLASKAVLAHFKGDLILSQSIRMRDVRTDRKRIERLGAKGEESLDGNKKHEAQD